MNNQGLEALAALASAAPSSMSGRAPGETLRGGELGSGARESTNEGRASSSDAGDSVRETNNQSAQSTQVGGEQHASAAQLAQWQQLVSSLSSSAGNANHTAPNPNLSLLSGIQHASQLDNSSLMMAMQNMAYYQLMAQSQAANQNQLSALSTLATQLSRASPQASGLGFSLQNPLVSLLKDTSGSNQPAAAAAALFAQQGEQGRRDNQSVPSNITLQNAGKASSDGGQKKSLSAPTRRSTAPIAPQPTSLTLDYRDSDGGESEGPMEDKREQKRAANRRSAQLSRKRKKQFIEELKEENDELRRKEQILKSLPDLVVVFDSSGKLGFVSHSVDRLLNFAACELEGSSFWDRLCEDSVRLLKAAFMDSLATREAGSDTAPLGTGVWELRLVDKDGTQKVVALNGVVHFTVDKPECVCTIRPRDKGKSSTSNENNSKKSGLPSVAIDSRQSAVSATERPSAAKKVKVGKVRDSVRISDSGNSTPESGDSVSGSSDE